MKITFQWSGSKVICPDGDLKFTIGQKWLLILLTNIYDQGSFTTLLEPPKGPVLAPEGPLEGPEGPWTSPGGQIWAQMPAASPPGWTASISSALATQETFTALPGPPKGPVLAPGGPLGAPEFFTPNIGKWGVQSDATVCPDHKPPYRSI